MVAIISLGTDCLIAILYPLKYRTIVTAKRTINVNGVVIFILFIIIFVFPMATFSWRFGGYVGRCNVLRLYSYEYIVVSVFLSVTLLVLMMILNIVIIIAVAVALLRRQKLTGASGSTQKRMMRVVMRLLFVIFVNLGMSFPLITVNLNIRIFHDWVAYVLFVSLGVWNNLIYFVGDSKVRDRVLQVLKRGHKLERG